MDGWEPLAVSPDEYTELLAWWSATHPGTVKDGLGASCWDDWIQDILER
jgi:hypothetical protein